MYFEGIGFNSRLPEPPTVRFHITFLDPCKQMIKYKHDCLIINRILIEAFIIIP
jgi:hypothetical protein